MSKFELSGEVDSEKIFLINLSEIENRIDCEYYRENLDFSNCIKLKEFVKVKGGKRLPKEHVYSNNETEYLYLRVSNFSSDNDVLDFNDLKFINKDTFEILERYEVIENDLIFSIAGTVGKLKLISNIPNNRRIILTENAAKIEIISNEILPKYLEIILKTNFLQKQINLNYIQTTIPKIGLDRVENLFIPKIPSKEIQENIINIYEAFLLEKQQKEQKAKELLDSIDDYLLDELGITLPEVDNSLEKRIFEVNFSEISGGRFDSDYYSYSYEIMMDAVSKANVENINEIDSVVSVIQSGKTPSSIDYSDEVTEFPIIKAGSYTNEYIDLNKLDYTKTKNNLEVEKGDIFILSAAHQSQYVGKQIKILNDEVQIQTSYVGELICIRAIKELCNPMYLFSLLNLDILKTLLNREKTGQTSHIYGKDIKHIKIPLPPIEKQNEIAQHIQAIRDKVKQLQDEAKKALDEAKNEVERLILGE